MKKIIFSVTVCASMFAGAAFAAGTAISSGQLISTTNCTLLQDDVKLTLSNGVIGAYNCVANANSVLVSTCHTAGRIASRSVDTPCVKELSADADVAKTQVKCDNPDVAYNRKTSTGAAFYIGNTAGGAIGPATLDGSSCAADKVVGKI